MFGNPKLIALPVIASFDANGNICPLYFRYNGKSMKLSVISRRECLPTIEFLCSYDDDGYFGQIELSYWVPQHTWTYLTA